MFLAILILVWLVCAFLAFGICYAFLRANFYMLPPRNDQIFAFVWSLAGGPMSLVVAVIMSGLCKHGFRWRK